MTRELLIHSMAEFAPITLPLLEAVNAKIVCEIGAEHGGNSKVLFEWLKAKNGKLISIDPKPSHAFMQWLLSTGNIVQHVPKLSHTAIPEVGAVDAWFIDGDHNWYTVYNELLLIREVSRKENRPLMVFMHDIGWPWGKRDLYYAPDQIPENFRQPYTWDEGVTLDSVETIKGGFRGNGAFAVALKEGGPQNGVMTAIDDFTKKYPGEICFAYVPAVFGLGVMFDLNHPQANLIAAMIAPFHNNALLEKLEINRLANYLKVIEWQDRTNGIEPVKRAQPAPSMARPQESSTVTNIPPAPLPQQSVEEKQASASENRMADFESKTVSLLNYLNDHQNQADVWEQVRKEIYQDQETLVQFTQYLSLLLNVPQNADALKLIASLEAVCHAYGKNIALANQKFSQLVSQYANSPLIVSAFRHANHITESV